MAQPRGNFFAALPARVPREVLEAVRESAPGGLRWFHPADLHITLAFFGREDRTRFPAIREVLQRIDFEGTEVRLGSLLLLPRPRTFTALSFKLRAGRDEITPLIEQWRGPLLVAGECPPDVRPPLPHLTILRPDRKDPEFDDSGVTAWARSLPVIDTAIQILPPVLCGWGPDYADAAAAGRPKFRVIAPHPKTA